MENNNRENQRRNQRKPIQKIDTSVILIVSIAIFFITLAGVTAQFFGYLERTRKSQTEQTEKILEKLMSLSDDIVDTKYDILLLRYDYENHKNTYRPLLDMKLDQENINKRLNNITNRLIVVEDSIKSFDQALYDIFD